MIPYLIMWILLMIKTKKQDILGLERIGKVYSYVSGSLEIIGAIAQIISSIHYYTQTQPIQPNPFQPTPPPYSSIPIGYIIVSVIYLIFACLKIHGIRVENNKLVGIYLGFRHALFVLQIITCIILKIVTTAVTLEYFMIAAIVYFILDIGLTVILHSIRVDRENTARTENEDEEPLIN